LRKTDIASIYGQFPDSFWLVINESISRLVKKFEDAPEFICKESDVKAHAAGAVISDLIG